jgi:hypothetical protein
MPEQRGKYGICEMLDKIKSKTAGFLPKFVSFIKLGKSTPFVVNGRMPYAVIGALIILLGLQFSATGVILNTIGEKAKARYEKKSGQLIRNFSEEDVKYYQDSQKIMRFASALILAGFFGMFLGLIVLLNPQLLFLELKRLGLTQEAKPDLSVKKPVTRKLRTIK